jgi:putative two-component system response regulator
MKPGTLTTDERKVIQQHVELGYELLRPLRTFKNALPAVRFHHERLDGSGYPLGLRGDEIPLSAQVLAIVDVYDALTTDRVYRPAFTQQKSFEILRDEVQRGLHDSELVEAFISLINS